MSELSNQRGVTFTQRIKQMLLQFKYGKALECRGKLRILGALPIVKAPGGGRVVLGDKVVLNSDFRNSNTAICFRCTLVCGLTGLIEIGDNTMMNGVAITAYSKVSIGRNCQIASGTLITDTDYHPVDPEIRVRQALGYKIDHDSVGKKPVTIGENVWIGWGCTILKGVTIGANSIIAAGSIVTKDVPANVLAAGNPATIKKYY